MMKEMSSITFLHRMVKESLLVAYTARTNVIRLKRASGFTLIELMVVVVIVAIFAAIAIPSYQEYVRRANATQAQQEVQRIAGELERWKSRNFNYLGFNLNPNTVQNYTFEIKDGMTGNPNLTATAASGRSWVIRAERSDEKSFSFLMTSSGIRCKNKTKANVTFDDCGTNTGEEQW